MITKTEFDIVLWKPHILQQVQLCKRLGVEHVPTDPHQIIGLADDSTSVPTNGLRHPIEQNTAGWYIWSGTFSMADSFFKPLHAYHLLTIKPELIKYLGLPAGYRFLIDDKGYEDIWFDDSLLDVS
jgi:hypothetical protein